MTPIILGADLSKVHARCEKHYCKTKQYQLHRHHMRHEHMFVSAFSWRLDEDRYKKFVERYFSFDRRDVVNICGPHHREIHLIYDPIITAFLRRVRKPLRDFTWGEAEELMAKLFTSCNDWLALSTKGSKLPWSHTRPQAEKPSTAAEWLHHARRLNP